MTHVWQWLGGGQGDIAPGGLIEGIADFVRLRAGLAPPPGRWVKPGRAISGTKATTLRLCFWIIATD
ncbi:unnamed protein product [Linum tenue]|nr:unnamed protein product [Linum tenue]